MKTIFLAIRMTYDEDAGAAYLYFKSPVGPGEVRKTTHVVFPDVNIDQDVYDQLLGIEILDVKLLPNVIRKELGLDD
jgi:uncharacterized protein YuzE